MRDLPPAAVPRACARLLRALLPLAEREEVLADLAEEYAHRTGQRGRTAARLWIWRQVVASGAALLRRSVWRGMDRLRTSGEPRTAWRTPDGRLDHRPSVRAAPAAHAPAVRALAVLTLALGVGGAAAISGIVRGRCS